MSWSYNGNDIGITLFDACRKAGAPIDFKLGSLVLEACCSEEDWLERAAAAWPTCGFVGVDQAVAKCSHGDNWERYRQDMLQTDAFACKLFDAVVSLSAIEHIGLGHYGDTKDPDGDTKAMANIWEWLKPDGFVYFDVPYDPTGYRVITTECRVYDDEALTTRLKNGFAEVWRGYAPADKPGTLIEKPTEPHRRFYYAAMVWRPRWK